MELFVLNRNTWNHLTEWQKTPIQKCYQRYLFTNHIWYIYKEDLALKKNLMINMPLRPTKQKLWN